MLLTSPMYYLLFTPGEVVVVKTYMLLLTTYYLILTISVCNFTLFRFVTYYLPGDGQSFVAALLS